MTNFAGIFRNMHFLQYKGFQKQSVGGGLKVLAKYLKTVFGEELSFIINLLYQNSIKKYEDDLEY